MPVSEQQYQRARKILETQQNLSPEIRSRLEQHVNNYVSENQYGPPTADQVAPRPADTSTAGYFYEPNLHDFQDEFQNPALQKELGFADRYSDDAGNKSVGASYLESKVPELANISKKRIGQLTTDSPEYKAYADRAYKIAKESDPTLERYEDISFKKNPFNKALGAVVKHGPAVALGAARGVSAGLGPALAAEMVNETNQTRDPGLAVAASLTGKKEKAQNNTAAKARVSESLSKAERIAPTTTAVADLATGMLPFHPTNLLAEIAMEKAGFVTKEAARAAALAGKQAVPTGIAGAGTVARIGTSGAIGSGLNTAEGIARDISDPNTTWEETVKHIPLNAAVGAIGGKAGGAIAEASGAGRKAINESTRMVPAKNLKQAGGGFHVLKGVEAPAAIRENVSAAQASRIGETSTDVAAKKVAPKFKESFDAKDLARKKQAEATLEAYLSRPEVANQQESLQPVTDVIFDMFEKGNSPGPVTGDPLPANPGALRTFKEVLKNNGEVNQMAPEQAALYANKTGGKILSEAQAKALGLPVEAGKVPVYVAVKRGARDLLALEDMIDEQLKMDTTPGGANKPIWKNINRATKSVRDRFGVPEARPNNFGEPFSPASPSPPQASIEPQPQVNVGEENPFQAKIGRETIAPQTSLRSEAGPVGPGGQVSQPGYQGAERRQPGRPTDSEWERLSPRERANTPLSEYPEVATVPPEDATTQSYLERALKENEEYMAGLQKYADNPSSEPVVPTEPVGQAPNWHKPQRGVDPLTPSQRVTDDQQYVRDMNEVNNELNSGLSGRKSSDARYGNLREEFGDYEALNRPSEEIEPPTDQDAIREYYRNRKRENIALDEERARAAQADAESISPEEYQSIGPDVNPNKQPFTKRSEQSLYGKGSSNPDIDYPSTDIRELVRKSDEGYKGLNSEEKKAIDWWIGSSDSIKRPPVGQNGQPSKEVFDSAIKKLMATNPTANHPLIKRFNASEDELTRMLQSGEVQMPEHSSASYKDIEKFGQHKLNINKTSKAANLVGQNLTEAEMVIPGGGKYRITKHSRGPHGNHTFDLEEITSQINPTSDTALSPSAVARNEAALDDVIGGVRENLGISEPPVSSIDSENPYANMSDSEYRTALKEELAKRHVPQQAPVPEKMGLESQLDAQLLRQQIADKANLEGIENPLEPSVKPEPVPNPTPDNSIPEATLEDGTVVRGLSAVQRKNHLLLQLNDLEKAFQNSTDDSAIRKVQSYKAGEGQPYINELMSKEADELGLRQQLEEVAATRDFQTLKDRSWGGTNQGPLNAMKDIVAFRLDPILGAIAGQPANPFAPPPMSPSARIQNYLYRTMPSELVNQSGGRLGAKYAGPIYDEYEEMKQRNNF